MLLIVLSDPLTDYQRHMLQTALKVPFALQMWDVPIKCEPTVIVPMGPKALQVCTGYTAIEDWRGYIINPADVVAYKGKRLGPSVFKSGKRKGQLKPETVMMLPELPGSVRHIIPTLHPQRVMDSGMALLNVMKGDLDRAARFCKNPDLVVTGADEFSWASHLSGFYVETLAVDIETRPDGSIADIGFATDVDTASIQWPGDAKNVLRQCQTFIAHNAPFDLEHLGREMDMSHVKVFCTMLATYMLNPDGKKSLNWAISQYLDAKRHKHMMGTEYRRYNALDARQTYDLYWILRDGLKATGQLEFFEQGMMPALPTLIRMHERGMAVDLEWVNEWRDDLAHKLADIEAAVRASGGEVGLLEKPLLLANYLGTRNSDVETLTRLKIQGHPETPLIERVLEYRDLATNYSTYLQTTSRVHPNYLPGARDSDEGNKGIAYSGRPTASHPNIQNQPKFVRRQFVADETCVLVSLDWSQIEPRIAAALSGDEVFAADIEAGLYNAVSATIGCDRDTAKTVVLLSAYLGSPRTLKNKLMLEGINLTLAESKELQDKMFARYHKWAEWRQGVVELAAKQKWLRNPFGKWAPFVRPHASKAVNFFPQSCAACCLWYCLPQIEKVIAPYGGLLYNTVHDEVTFQAPKLNYSILARAAKVVMEQSWPQLNGLSVPVKIKVGLNWRDQEAISC